MIDQIPQPPPVSSFKIPNPVSPKINLSMPQPPKKIDNKSTFIGERKSVLSTSVSLFAGIVCNFSLTIAHCCGENLSLLDITNKSILFCSIYSYTFSCRAQLLKNFCVFCGSKRPETKQESVEPLLYYLFRGPRNCPKYDNK